MPVLAGSTSENGENWKNRENCANATWRVSKLEPSVCLYTDIQRFFLNLHLYAKILFFLSFLFIIARYSISRNLSFAKDQEIYDFNFKKELWYKDTLL